MNLYLRCCMIFQAFESSKRESSDEEGLSRLKDLHSSKEWNWIWVGLLGFEVV